LGQDRHQGVSRPLGGIARIVLAGRLGQGIDDLRETGLIHR
jgi:hypothetical protein